MGDTNISNGELALRLVGATEDDARRLVRDALEALALSLGADRAYVTVYHDDGSFQNRFEWTSEGVVPQLPVIQRLRSDDFAHSAELARLGEVWAVPDLEAVSSEAAGEYRSFSSFGVAAVLQVPVIVDGFGIGLVGLNHFETVDGWTSTEIEAVGDLGRAIGVALIRARADDATRRASEAERDALRARTELLAHVSHELRTPLHGLLGYAELLGLRDDLGSDRHAVSQIETSGRRLLAMVDDLIDLAESSDVRIVDVAIESLVDQAAEGLAMAALQRHVEIRSDESLAGASIRAEQGRVRQILYCALSGAIQSVSERATITVSADLSSADAQIVTLSVSTDDGADRSDMALALARTLVEGHGTIEHTVRDDGFDVVISFDTTRPRESAIATT